MFIAILFLAFIFILLLIFQHRRSRHKKLISVTIVMIMTGMICWGYHELDFSYSYKTNMNKGVFGALINQEYVFTIGMCLLILSIPCTLFCLLSKPKPLREIDKPLEENDDLYG